MKCQILVSGKNKKNIINLSSAENAQRVVKVKKRSVSFCREDLLSQFLFGNFYLSQIPLKPQLIKIFLTFPNHSNVLFL